MAWLWFGLGCGLSAAAVIMWREILTAYRERGLWAALGEWAGTATVTTPILVLVVWLAHGL